MSTRLLEVAVIEGQWVGVTRQPFASAPVGVLDGTFLPWRLWVAESGLNTEAGLQVGPVGEFRAAVEGDGTTCCSVQGRQRLDQSIHDRF